MITQRKPVHARTLVLQSLPLLGLIGLLYLPQVAKPADAFKILVFSKTAAYRHTSIDNGLAAIRALGSQYNFAVDASEDAAVFTDSNLQQYRVVVFLSTTSYEDRTRGPALLNTGQRAAFERYIRAGGGFVGIHAASDAEYDWPWYGGLVGAYFKDHPNNPNVRGATIDVTDRTHPSTAHLPARWQRSDEWYNFRTNPRGKVQVLATLDESTYQGGTMGDDHPIAWYHNYDGGRAWYTAGGHTAASFAEDTFRRHILGGIQWAAGGAAQPTGENTYLPTVIR